MSDLTDLPRADLELECTFLRLMVSDLTCMCMHITEEAHAAHDEGCFYRKRMEDMMRAIKAVRS